MTQPILVLDDVTQTALAGVGAPLATRGAMAALKLPVGVNGPPQARPWHWPSTEDAHGVPSFQWWFGPPDYLHRWAYEHGEAAGTMGPRSRWSRSPALASDRRTVMMGIVNVTPDSFSDGGQAFATDDAVAATRRLFRAGADWVDLGGESTRPGHRAVDPSEEWARIGPVIHALTAPERSRLSIDTRHASVAAEAAALGIGAVNDVSCLGEPEMLECLRTGDLGYVLMYNRRERYLQGQVDLVEILQTLENRMGVLNKALGGLHRVVVDPGLGFAYGLSDNLRILRALRAFGFWGVPVLLGPSRKAFLGRITGHEHPADRDTATAAVAALAVGQGVDVLRVHNVGAVIDAVRVAEAWMRGG